MAERCAGRGWHTMNTYIDEEDVRFTLHGVAAEVDSNFMTTTKIDEGYPVLSGFKINIKLMDKASEIANQKYGKDASCAQETLKIYHDLLHEEERKKMTPEKREENDLFWKMIETRKKEDEKKWEDFVDKMESSSSSEEEKKDKKKLCDYVEKIEPSSSSFPEKEKEEEEMEEVD